MTESIEPVAQETSRELMTPVQRANELLPFLERRSSAMASLLADSGVSVERFQATVIHAIAKQPSLLECTKESVLMAVMDAARMGLEPTGQYGGAYLIRRKGAAVLEVDWRGFIRMAMREGAISRAHSAIVYEGDEFEWQEGTNPRIDHRPTRGGAYGEPERGGVTHAYAIAWLPDGSYEFTVMTVAQLMAIKERSSSKKDGRVVGPWVSDPEEMMRKTAIRRLFKYIPAVYNPALQYALDREDRIEAEPVAVEPMQITSRRASVVAALSGEEAERAAATDTEEGLPDA